MTRDSNKLGKMKNAISALIKQYGNEDDSQDGCDTNMEDFSAVHNETNKVTTGICNYLLTCTGLM